MDIGSFKEYLSGRQSAEDADSDKVSVAKTFLKKTLSEHDKIYHPNGYKEGDDCNFRRMMQKNDNVDAIVSEEPKESTKLGLVKFEEKDDGKKQIVDVVEVDEAKGEIDEALAERYLAAVGSDKQH